MRVPWAFFTAIAALGVVAIANLQTRAPLLPQEVQRVLRADASSPAAKHKGTRVETLAPLSRASTQQPVVAAVDSSSLIIPVVGVVRRQLTDTWGQARSQRRTHEGIDILAPQSTPVVAAADGRIAKFFDSARGGITIYQFDAHARFVYYYAHLSGRAPGLLEGATVRQGQIIGFVGMTGNAPVPHLHFEVERLGPEKHWWHTEARNPYPLLMAGRAPYS